MYSTTTRLLRASWSLGRPSLPFFFGSGCGCLPSLECRCLVMACFVSALRGDPFLSRPAPRVTSHRSAEVLPVAFGASHTMHTPNGPTRSNQTASDPFGSRHPRPTMRLEQAAHTYQPAGVHHPRRFSAILPACGACSAASRIDCAVSFICERCLSLLMGQI